MHLIRIAIDRKIALSYGRHMGLTLEAVDWGYLVHMQLTGLFDVDAPRPFFFDPTKEEMGKIAVLGYSELDADHLRTAAQTFAEPGVFNAVDWDTFASKPMPKEFQRGQRFGFITRVCPVEGRSGSGGRGEQDVFLRKARQRVQSGSGKFVDRWSVYQDWLSPKFQYRNAAKLESMRIQRFAQDELVRRGKADKGETRPVHVLRRPDVTLGGDLTVEDPAAFELLLRQGVGRHRGFGFGMLLLARASGL